MKSTTAKLEVWEEDSVTAEAGFESTRLTTARTVSSDTKRPNVFIGDLPRVV
jgi:hypothetical protein